VRHKLFGVTGIDWIILTICCALVLGVWIGGIPAMLFPALVYGWKEPVKPKAGDPVAR
jgi:hypothetical protein